MSLVRYTPEYAGLLRQSVAAVDPTSALSHAPFVNYYYCSRDDCNLSLLISADGKLSGTIGVEHIRFRYHQQQIALGFASNYYAMERAAGALLFKTWLNQSAVAMVFGGSEHTHRILTSQKWTYFHGIRTLSLNPRRTPHQKESGARRAAKTALNWIRPRLSKFANRIPRGSEHGVTVKELKEYQDSIFQFNSCFELRIEPDIEYIRWRFNPTLGFVRYRIFRILHLGGTAGYVILNDHPDRLIVAQADGTEPDVVAYGVMLSLMAASRDDSAAREAVLTCAHPAMIGLYRSMGFKSSPLERPFALDPRNRHLGMGNLDLSKSSINFDLGDNGLRTPFLDQIAC